MATVAENSISLLVKYFQKVARVSSGGLNGKIKVPDEVPSEGLSTSVRFKQQVYQEIWAQIVEMSDVEFPLKLASESEFGDFPEGEFLTAASESPLVMMDLLPVIGRVVNESFLLKGYCCDSGRTHIEFDLAYPQKAANEYLEFMMLLFDVKWGACYLPPSGPKRPLPLETVCFRHPPKMTIDQYKKYFKVDDILFDQPVNRLVYGKEMTQFKGKSANNFVFQTIKEHFLKFKEFGLSDGNFLIDLQKVILQQLGNSQLSLGLIANELKISERSLQRRLKKLDQSFQDVLQHVRMQEARRLLLAGVQIKDIPPMVGYSSLSAFSNSYLAHFNHRPSQSPERS